MRSRNATSNGFLVIGLTLLALAAVRGCATTAPVSHFTRPVTVTVTDEESLPVDGALVNIIGASVGMTNLQGFIVFDNLPVGVHHVCVKAEGYNDACLDSDNQVVQLSLVATPQVVVRGPLHIAGGNVVYPDGQPFDYISATAFQLNQRMLVDPEAATAWMSARRIQGFTVLRVLVALNGYFTLSEADGIKTLPHLLEVAREKDIYVQVVAIADHEHVDFKRRVQLTGQQCAAFENCILEIANEPYQNAPDVYSDKGMRALQALVPSNVGVVIWGAPRNSEWGTFSGSPLFSAHLPRFEDYALRIGGMFDLATFKRPALDGEPYGFAESATTPGNPNRRETRAGVALAQGATARGLGIASTFHSNPGLTAEPFGPVVLRAANAFTRGFTCWKWGPLRPVGRQLATVEGARSTSTYTDGNGRGMVVALGVPQGLPAISVTEGWHVGRQLARVDDVVVIEVRR